MIKTILNKDFYFRLDRDKIRIFAFPNWPHYQCNRPYNDVTGCRTEVLPRLSVMPAHIIKCKIIDVYIYNFSESKINVYLGVLFPST